MIGARGGGGGGGKFPAPIEGLTGTWLDDTGAVMTGPLITGPLMTGPLDSPELLELTESMEGALDILLRPMAGEAGILQC